MSADATARFRQMSHDVLAERAAELEAELHESLEQRAKIRDIYIAAIGVMLAWRPKDWNGKRVMDEVFARRDRYVAARTIDRTTTLNNWRNGANQNSAEPAKRSRRRLSPRME